MDTRDRQISKEFRVVLKRLRNIVVKTQPLPHISMGEYALLRAIKDKTQENEDFQITCSELSELLQISKPATSRMMNLMEERGYIVRYNEKKDRRVVYVHITSEGEKLLQDEWKYYKQFTEHVSERMGTKDMIEFIRIGNKMCDILKDEMKQKFDCET